MQLRTTPRRRLLVLWYYDGPPPTERQLSLHLAHEVRFRLVAGHDGIQRVPAPLAPVGPHHDAAVYQEPHGAADARNVNTEQVGHLLLGQVDCPTGLLLLDHQREDVDRRWCEL